MGLGSLRFSLCLVYIYHCATMLSNAPKDTTDILPSCTKGLYQVLKAHLKISFSKHLSGQMSRGKVSHDQIREFTSSLSEIDFQ